MLHKFNSVMKLVTNRSDLLVCSDCFSFFINNECPKCDNETGIAFKDLPDHDQEYIKRINKLQ